MKYRKGINVSDATEKELIRYQMERIVKESCDENLGECSMALAELCKLFKNVHDGIGNKNAEQAVEEFNENEISFVKSEALKLFCTTNDEQIALGALTILAKMAHPF